MDAGKVGIFEIRQATILRFTMTAMAIPVARWLSLAELTRPSAILALSDTRVLRLTVARTSSSAFCRIVEARCATWHRSGTISPRTTLATLQHGRAVRYTRGTQSRRACWTHTRCRRCDVMLMVPSAQVTRAVQQERIAGSREH